MAISINSSLKPSPPTTTSPPDSSSLSSVHPPKAIQVPCSWRRRCFTGVACMIIGSTAGFGVEESGIILAEELRGVGGSEGKVAMRWSDKRSCPQWHANSLENIVPENLPRPSARRRFESVSIDRTAPALVGVSARNVSGCFSM
ncbi:Histone deacetylase 18 -like protein [Cinnamomum micranthum f. kanehirae]|uniref:Histone deacetylase 18-like protein n=1 Tax=Cinnamomum micranthum f. kanehirae TaxID=337451 RepID=A0A443NG09_9MAGN|nr:Histone deacetylase 18 -like protein [Cinnamomum micranthum f. kanehirae]